MMAEKRETKTPELHDHSSALPPEILARILKYLVLSSDSTKPYQWITTTHVCMRWRTVGLNDATLWSRLHVTACDDWVTELLKRSGRAALVVYVTLKPFHQDSKDNSTDEDRIRVFKSVAKERARIASLSIAGDQKIAMQLMKMLDGPMPRLAAVTVKGDWRSPADRQRSGFLPILRSCDLKGGLRRLELESYNFQWTDLIIQSLKHLKLACIPDVRRTSLQVILGTLEKLPQLETLELLGQFISHNAPVPTKTFTLSSLRALSIEIPVDLCLQLFECALFPNLSEISLIAECKSDPDTVSTRLSTILPASIMSSLYSLRIHEHESSGTRSQLRASFYRKNTAEITRSTARSIAIDFGRNCEAAVKRLVSFMNHFDASGLRKVEVDDVGICWATNWRSLLANMANVRDLRISEDIDAPSYLDALKPQARQHVLPLPRLRTLRLDKIRLSDWKSVRWDREDSSSDTDYKGHAGIDEFCVCMIERYECGAGIRKLYVTDCVNFDQEDVDLLSEVVPDVEWDGQVVFDSGCDQINWYDGHTSYEIVGGVFPR
ncbi:uncharacterized protein LAESUDRAFT_811595 [Laetiporus sulphureus 93-53]|uniref:F-box domain-containing protein n=1 Tax=Laetiporus sulphureus 93-53 TaxID=1314785 RepID=A0A165F0F2_9APHY|nr:uncharacterized protein LAESUDRAFT_811595 [Laetiporus sulphureus 93-53]KZT08100.1 hypothetical protein LAESUDRAFT_811595 [Laetiporus sulphureus 93-53]